MHDPPRVLVVDDEPHNLSLLRRVMRPLKYEVGTACDGRSALDQVSAHPPDLILLDVMMPGMSGFDMCRRLKSEPETQAIPIIIVTGLDDRNARVTGLEAGADDFLNKPADPNEVRARVRSLLRAKALFDELQQRYEELRELQVMRESLTHMIVHDLRNPLAVMKSYLSMMEEEFADASEEVRGFFTAMDTSTESLLDMTTSILDLAQLEAGKMALAVGLVSLGDLVSHVTSGMQAHLVERENGIDAAVPAELPPLWADEEIVRRILVNIVSNAITFSPRGGRIAIVASAQSHCVRVEVADQGPGIPAEFRERIFEKFGQIENRQEGSKYSTGLGLAFCKIAVEAHGGEIGVEGSPGQGSRFWFTIPLAHPSP